MNPINAAIEIRGGVSQLARDLGVSIQAVRFWRDGQRKFPAALGPTVERLTECKVVCESLCPEVEWAFIRGTAAAASPVASTASAA